MDRDATLGRPSARHRSVAAVTASSTTSTSRVSSTSPASVSAMSTSMSTSLSPTAPLTTPISAAAAPLSSSAASFTSVASASASATASATASASSAASASVTPTPVLSRSVSQQSAASSSRSSSRRRLSRRTSGQAARRSSSQQQQQQQSRQASLTSDSSAASEDNKSLTSFPSFSPKAPAPPSPSPPPAASRPRLAKSAASSSSLLDGLFVQNPLAAAASAVAPPLASLLSVTGPTASMPSTSSVTAASARRSALFEDDPLPPSSYGIPGALHLTDDAHIARLINKHGAVALVRQLAEDLALRDAQVAALRTRATDREHILRKIILECGLSSLDLETRMRTLEQEQEARLRFQARAAAAAALEGRSVERESTEQVDATDNAANTCTTAPSRARNVSDLVSDAMSDDNSLRQASSDYYYNDATIRAASVASRTTGMAVTGTDGGSRGGTVKGWKDYLWGGGSGGGGNGGAVKKTVGGGNGQESRRYSSQSQSQIQSHNQNHNQGLNHSHSHVHPAAAVRIPLGTDSRRPTISNDLFEPLNAVAVSDSGRRGSQASSVHSTTTSQSGPGRKPSLASMALRLVVGGNNTAAGDNTPPSSKMPGTPAPSTSASAAAALRLASSSGTGRRAPPPGATGRSSRAATMQGNIGGVVGVGPRLLMSMRRSTSSAILTASGSTGTGSGSGSGPQNIPTSGPHSGNGHAHSHAHERWGEMMDASPASGGGDSLAMRRSAYFPVEMDTILPLDVQPPTLTHMYDRYNRSGHLIDRFGFIYDQRRKKRQREATQVARHMQQHGSSRPAETLSMAGRASRNGRPSPNLLADELSRAAAGEGRDSDGNDASDGSGYDDISDDGSDNNQRGHAEADTVGVSDSADTSSLRSNILHTGGGSPAASLHEAAREVPLLPGDSGSSNGSAPKRWQDYLKIATFPTELLSHTPAMSDARIEVITEDGGAPAATGTKSPGFISSDGRGLMPPSSGALVASVATATTARDTDSIASIASGTTEATLDDTSRRHLRDALSETPSAETQASAHGTDKSDKPDKVAPTVSTSHDKAKKRKRASNRHSAMIVKDDVEPVRLLLGQLCELHDNLQKERTVRWNEFLRKVRAERRREGELAVQAAVAAAAASSASAATLSSMAAVDPRFARATAVMPETRLADGELIGIAGLGNKGKLGRAKWNEFRTLVLGGIPVILRAKVWAESTGATSLRVPGAYDDLVAGRGGDAAAAGTYVGDSGSSSTSTCDVYEDRADVVAQIQADIHRTLTDNIFFREGPGTAKLHDVLLAYARRNPDVGYCQGMNLIAANLLLVSPSAEDAFWLLASIIESILPAGYYDHSLAASRADQQVLRTYVAEVLPRLSAHFDALAIDLETMTFQWFLSVFTDCLSAEALFRVWDVVFCLGDGSVFLFQVALALLKLNEAALLACTTPAATYTYINHQMTNHAISIDGLIQASEALRKLIRREDVDARRATAMAAERALAAERVAAVQEARAARQKKVAAKRAAEVQAAGV